MFNNHPVCHFSWVSRIRPYRRWLVWTEFLVLHPTKWVLTCAHFPHQQARLHCYLIRKSKRGRVSRAKFPNKTASACKPPVPSADITPSLWAQPASCSADGNRCFVGEKHCPILQLQGKANYSLQAKPVACLLPHPPCLSTPHPPSQTMCCSLTLKSCFWWSSQASNGDNLL